MRPYFKFQLKADDVKKATLAIYDEIGAWGVSAAGFRAGMEEVKDADEITVEINSYGGDVFAGMAIYNMLKASGKKINVVVMGVAASAASLIAMAGDVRSMPKNAFMMIHNPWGVAIGNSAEMRETADLLDKIGSSVQGTYAAVTGLADDKLTEMLGKDTWLTADESLAMGFATVITDEVEAKASFSLDEAKLPANVAAIYAAASKTPEQIEAEADAVERADAKAKIDSGETVAKSVNDMVVKAGLADYAPHIVLHASSAEDAQTRIKVAKEVVALATFAKRPEAEIKALVRSDKSVAECRAAIISAQADEDVHTSATRPAQTTPNASAGMKKPADVYAARAAARKARKA